jgi:endoglucanase
MIKYFTCISFCFLSLLNFETLRSQTNVSEIQKQFLHQFEAGVDISHFEHYWSDANAISKKDIFRKLALAKKLGFKTIGLPIAIDLFLEKDKKTFHPNRLQKLQKIFEYIDNNHMNLIITYHFGVTRNLSEKEILSEIERGEIVWGGVLNYFKGKGYNNLFFGLYDEPRTTNETWEYVNKAMMKVLRPIDANRFWIIGSNNYMNVNAFEHLQPIPNDHKVLYTFHFYHPYIFTHQGAPWDTEKAYIKGLPYPYAANEMPPMPAKAKGTDMEYNYNNYYQKGNRDYLEGLIKIAHNWSVKNQVPIICTETGTLKSIPEKYRNNYFKDVTELMKDYDIPLIVWDFDQNLGVLKNDNTPIKSIADWIQSFQ